MTLIHRIGRRGGSLLFLALVDLVYGASLLIPDAPTAKNPLYIYLTRLAPLGVWGLAWAAVGTVMVIQAFAVDDRFAFGVGAFWKLLWGVLSLGAWGDGVPRAYVGAVIWIAFAGFVVLLSGWPEAPIPRPDPSKEGEP